MNSRPAKQSIKAKSDVMTFGKYKGKTIRWLLEHDPSYIIWLEEETEVEISQEILDNAKDEEINQQMDNAMDWWMGESPHDWDDD